MGESHNFQLHFLSEHQIESLGGNVLWKEFPFTQKKSAKMSPEKYIEWTQ